MRAKIGKRLLSTLFPKEKPFEIADTDLTGFILRVQPSGVMTYYATYRLDGEKNRHKIGRTDHVTPAQARDKAKIILGNVANGIDPAAAKKASKSKDFATYLDTTYGPWVEAHRKNGKATLARLKSCFSCFDKRKLADITTWNVEKWRSARLKAGIKPSTVNRDLAALKSALNKAVEWGVIQENPIAKVRRLKVDSSPMVRFLSEDEEGRLRSALFQREQCIRQRRDNSNEWRRQRGYQLLPDLRQFHYADHLTPLVLLSINTGIRKGELFSLTWEHVDLKTQMITIEGGTTKSQQTRHIPLNKEALFVLQNWQDQTGQTTGLVFPGPKGKKMGNVKRSWGKVLKAAEIECFRWHDLRHHFASRLVMRGVDLNTVRELLGHSDIQMTLRYAHLAPEHKAAAVEKLLSPS